MSSREYDPVWKRWKTVSTPSAVDDAANVMSGYEQQLELHFTPRDATPEEAQEWQEKELAWWGDRQLMFVTIAVIIQMSALAFMGAVMLFNQAYFS
tara:strand:+ start:483 stop:770 length:288 start_codon:yes stop_codon:yes gene_type:complete